MVNLYSYDEQREHPLHPSSTSELISHLRILFLTVFKVLADLTSGDNLCLQRIHLDLSSLLNLLNIFLVFLREHFVYQ